MKIHHLLLIASTLSLAAAGSIAQPVAQSLAEPPALTRAEVLADLELYRESGLAQLNDGPIVSSSAAEYQAAQRRYRELRASPRYAALVRAHGGPDLDGNAMTTAQAPAAGTATQR